MAESKTTTNHLVRYKVLGYSLEYDTAEDAWASAFKLGKDKTVVKITYSTTIEELPRPHVQPTLREVSDAMINGNEITIQANSGELATGLVVSLAKLQMCWLAIVTTKEGINGRQGYYFVPGEETK